MSCGYGFEIWECDGVDLTECTGYSRLWDGLDDFWDEFLNGTHFKISPATGAMFATKVKLLNKVYSV